MMSCGAEKHDGYVLSGEIKGIADGKIVLSYYDRGQKKSVTFETAIIKKGEFELKGKMDYPQELNVMITPGNASFSLWMENAQITVKGDMKKARADQWGGKTLPVEIEGGKIELERQVYEALLQPIREEQKPYALDYNEANMAYIKGMKRNCPKRNYWCLKAKLNWLTMH